VLIPSPPPCCCLDCWLRPLHCREYFQQYVVEPLLAVAAIVSEHREHRADGQVAARTNLFFVTWWHTVTAAIPVQLTNSKVLLGVIGERFMQHLVGGVDFTGTVNGKFAGYSSSLQPVFVFPKR
jgi:hypothetical protein